MLTRSWYSRRMFARKRSYLDYAAGMPANPSSPHAEGRGVRERLETARMTIARLTERKMDDVIFTSGATYANALAILGAVRAREGKRHVLYHPGAHASIVENVFLLREEGVDVEPLTISGGRIDIDRLRAQLTDATVLVSLDAVCGETGSVWHTRAVRAALDAHAASAESRRILLHVDASQAPFTEKLEMSHHGADLLVFDGSKLGVPGSGCLIAHRTIPLVPPYRGGGQERGLANGTQNVEAQARFARSLAALARDREGFGKRSMIARESLLVALREVPGLVVNEGDRQAPQIVNVSLPGRDTDYLVTLLDEAGFAVSTRSACETDSDQGSRAVFALTGDLERARSTVRISWGIGTKPRHLQRFARALRDAVRFIDAHAIT